MNNFRLNAGDILVNVNRRKDPISTIKRWAVGPFEHVFLYMGRLALGVGWASPYWPAVPMLFESSGRGVVLQTLANRYGQEVVVMRLKDDGKRIPPVLMEAIKLASEPNSFYDYLCIVQFILPRLLCEKLGLPMPLKYQRNPWHICSECVYEAFHRGGLLDILPSGVVPLPGDFILSPLLEPVWAGKMTEVLVSGPVKRHPE